MATIADIPATSFRPATATPAAFFIDAQGNPYWSFPDGSDTFIDTTRVAPTTFTGALTVVLHCRSAATTGVHRATVAVEAVSPGDALDTDAASGFDTANAQDSATVPGTAGHLFTITVTCTNADSLAAGDKYRLRVGRAGGHANDNAGAALHILHAEVRDGS